MPRRILTLISLLAFALLMVGPQSARAQDSTDHSPGVIVDGYTLTLASPAEAVTGNATVIVTLHDAHEQPVAGAIVSAALLAYLPAAGGHGAAHDTIPPAASHDPALATPAVHNGDTHTGMEGMPGMEDATSAPATPATDSMAGMPGMEAATSAPAAAAHDHGAASATEGHGLAPAPVLLRAGDLPGSYQGTLSFDQPGTWTVGVVFTIDGQEHGTTFDLAVAQGRPRGLVLGGFAAINALAIITAAVLRHRKPAKPAKPAPAAARAEEQI
jgi:hypothetical protein